VKQVLSLPNPHVHLLRRNPSSRRISCHGYTGGGGRVYAHTRSHAWAHMIGRTLVLHLNYRILLYLQCPYFSVYSIQGQIKNIWEKARQELNCPGIEFDLEQACPLRPLRQRKRHPRVLRLFTRHRRTVRLLPIACVLNPHRPLLLQPPFPPPQPSSPPLSRTQKGCAF
jgi:hypothetical protein